MLTKYGYIKCMGICSKAGGNNLFPVFNRQYLLSIILGEIR